MPNVIELVLSSAAGAFLDIGVFVGAVLLAFGLLNYFKAGALVSVLGNSKRMQPVLGALFGLIPGCGGSILLMPLYTKGVVTFGTIVATLIATTGDSSFVMIATRPLQFLIVSGIAFVVAIATGFLLDKTSLGASLREKYLASRRQAQEMKAVHKKYVHRAKVSHIGHSEGDEVDLALHHSGRGHITENTLGYRITHQGYFIYWAFLAVGLVLGVLAWVGIDIDAFAIPNLGLIFGVVGTTLSLLVMVASKKFAAHETHEETEMKTMSLKETIVHAAQDAAFVITWVFVGLLIYELSVLGLGGGDYAMGEGRIEAVLLTAGAAAIVVGSLVGIIPGCGPQIIFVTLYAQGLVPFAALLANSISQDGDALFPLLALDRRSAFTATLITALVALLAGFMVYWLELFTPLGRLFNI